MARQAGHKKSNAPSGQIRIIGGQWRGRKLPVLDLQGLRPTGDRLKETLFNWLQFELPNARILDVFAGTGSLGIEALSRGAAFANFMEKAPSAAKQLQHNLATLKVEHARVHCGDSLSLLKELGAEYAQSFDLVFLDPPFSKGLLQPTIDMLTPWLAERAWVYVETEIAAEFTVPQDWQLHREKQSGQVAARLYRREPEPHNETAG